MKSRTLSALAALMVFSLFAPAGRAAERRFSATLNAADSAQIGFARLTSDQVAVLDALVRNDINTAEFQRQPRPALFSQRLSDNERRNAGFDRLDATGLAQLDACVARFSQPETDGTSPSVALRSPAQDRLLTALKVRRDLEIHGAVTLMVASGSGGYSAYGGAIDLTLTDPAHRFTIGVGYSEMRSSGGNYDRWCYRR